MRSTDFTIYTPGIGTLSYAVSSPLGRIQRIFCSWCHSQSFQFSFHQVPITAGWTEAAWYERFCPTLYTLINFSDLRELVNFPCATIGVGDCEANQSSWHKAFVLQECPLGGTTLDALLCSLYWLFVYCLVHCLHLETNAGLLRDRRMVYALDHNPHVHLCFIMTQEAVVLDMHRQVLGIRHAQLRMKCSRLHLFSVHDVDSPACPCGHDCEDSNH